MKILFFKIKYFFFKSSKTRSRLERAKFIFANYPSEIFQILGARQVQENVKKALDKLSNLGTYPPIYSLGINKDNRISALTAYNNYDFTRVDRPYLIDRFHSDFMKVFRSFESR